MDEVTMKRIEVLAANNVKTNPALASILYAFLGASAMGREIELCALVDKFCRAELKLAKEHSLRG